MSDRFPAEWGVVFGMALFFFGMVALGFEVDHKCKRAGFEGASMLGYTPVCIAKDGSFKAVP